MNWREQLAAGLDRDEAQGLRRGLRTLAGPSRPEAVIDGRRVVQFASNNYLGLANHPRVVAAAQAAAVRWGTGSGASPLVAGHQAIHAQLEQALAQSKGAEAALVFATGSLANLGAMAVLPGEDGQVFLDKLDHATLYDGAKLSGAAMARFPHQDLGRLEALLAQARAAGSHRLVVAVDAVYSMDGDMAPLPQLLELAQSHDAILVVDEAHSTGVLGARGHGILEQFGIQSWPAPLVLTGTLSKALGSLGGYVAGPRVVIETLLNRSRAYIYATALGAPAAAAALEALQVMEDEPQHLRRLWDATHEVAGRLAALGWSTEPSVTPILPLRVGAAEQAMALQRRLWEAGFLVPAIRPPTVPANACRLRLSLSAEHEPRHWEALLGCLGRRP